MISSIEKIIAFRYLKPKRKEGFLKIISVFSFLGISLGVAVLIIVMSVMNGFRSELIDKTDHDELIYKLTLKYLRRDGYDIGNSESPEIKPIN